MVRLDERRMLLRGERTGTVFSLGQPVRVKVQNVELTQCNIDLTLLTLLKGARSARRPTESASATACAGLIGMVASGRFAWYNSSTVQKERNWVMKATVIAGAGVRLSRGICANRA
ncbi:MAG: hypothetical protein ACLVJB_01185 [Christensenellales bacterium]